MNTGGIRKYFEGRSTRRDYFFGSLGAVLVSLPLVFVLQVLFGTENEALLIIIYTIPIIISLPLEVRRMQDVGHSGAWVVFATIFSFAGHSGLAFLLTILLFFWPGNKAKNHYGDVPVSVGGFFRPLLNTCSVSTSNKFPTKVRISSPLGDREENWEIEENIRTKWLQPNGYIYVMEWLDNGEKRQVFTTQKVWDKISKLVETGADFEEIKRTLQESQ